jgi:hypothetical protein
MNEIDLIPSDYRARRWLERNALRFGFATVAIVVVAATAYAGMHHATQRANAAIETLRTQEVITARQGAELAELSNQKRSYESQLKLLNGLRGGASAESMFATIDRALADHEVWFVDWEFRRTGSVVEHDGATRKDEHLIVLAPGENQQRAKAWKMETHMSIKGQAIDHSALSRFVRRLLAQPEIDEVHVLSSSQRKYKTHQVVDFDLSVVVKSGLRDA